MNDTTLVDELKLEHYVVLRDLITSMQRMPDARVLLLLKHQQI